MCIEPLVILCINRTKILKKKFSHLKMLKLTIDVFVKTEILKDDCCFCLGVLVLRLELLRLLMLNKDLDAC